MRIELALDGNDVEFVAVNLPLAASTQQELIDVCSFPLWQDEPDVTAAASVGLAKDELIVLDRAGAVAAVMGGPGTIAPVLTTPEGYALVKGAILSVP